MDEHILCSPLLLCSAPGALQVTRLVKVLHTWPPSHHTGRPILTGQWCCWLKRVLERMQDNWLARQKDGGDKEVQKVEKQRKAWNYRKEKPRVQLLWFQDRRWISCITPVPSQATVQSMPLIKIIRRSRDNDTIWQILNQDILVLQFFFDKAGVIVFI